MLRRQPTAAKVFDIAEVEQDIEEGMRSIHPSDRPGDFAPPVLRTPAPQLPGYVSHRDDVSEIGKLSAEAMVKQFDDAAKEIEAMAKELTDAAKRCEQMVAGAHEAAGKCMEVAKTYREQGKRHFAEIEACSAMTEEVRKTCDAMMAKITSPVTLS
ncbi:hypothetical protein [Bradyrhizobium paxllaeri]|uniref:hypothetical protein n=1 Tax=Bradyrhizobium paxllaeri TaxID=190148 RepID=UPI000810C42C|nr:hypothetical protein [Bradyrhizobium paxllaeri]